MDVAPLLLSLSKGAGSNELEWSINRYKMGIKNTL